jgi:hypothetical protein
MIGFHIRSGADGTENGLADDGIFPFGGEGNITERRFAGTFDHGCFGFDKRHFPLPLRYKELWYGYIITLFFQKNKKKKAKNRKISEFLAVRYGFIKGYIFSEYGFINRDAVDGRYKAS